MIKEKYIQKMDDNILSGFSAPTRIRGCREFIKFKLVSENSKNPGREWKKPHPNPAWSTDKVGNVGVPTGKINDFIGFDIDYYKWTPDHPFFQFIGHTDVKKWALDQRTYTVETTNGGIHLYFKYTDRFPACINHKLDIDIKSNGGYLVGVGSRAINKKGVLGTYKCIQDMPVAEYPPDLADWTDEFIFTKTEQKRLNRKYNSVIIEQEKPEDYYKYDFSTVEINKILTGLPDEYWTGFDLFFKYTTALKSLNRKDIWLEYNQKAIDRGIKRKGNEAKDNSIWNGIKKHNSLNMVNHLLIKTKDEAARTMLDYNKYKPIYEEPLNGATKITRPKLGKMNDEDNDYVKLSLDKNYVIKSDTATGKTTLVERHILEHHPPIISIGSRVSLCESQYNDWSKAGINISNYNLEANYFVESGTSIIITIDSIKRLVDLDFSIYTVFLDEFNSLIEYLWKVPHIKEKVVCFQLLKKILTECKQFICVDADISCIVTKYLESVNREYELIVNTHQHNSGIECKELYNFDAFLTNCKEQIIQNKGCIIPTDSKTDAETIFRDLTLDRDPSVEWKGIDVKYKNGLSYALITSDSTHYQSLDNFDVVIFSPKIIYGLDSVRKRPVLAHFKEQTISPRAMIQQIARNRNITKLFYIFYQKKFKEEKFLDIDEVEQENKVRELLIPFKIMCSKEENKMYMDIYKIICYNEDCENTNKFGHFKRLLRSRGWKDCNRYFQTERKELLEANKKHKIREIEEFDGSEPRHQKINEYLNIPLHEMKRYKSLFLEQSALTYHLNIKNFFFKTDDKWAEMLEKKDDFNINKATNILNKFLYIKKIHSLLGVIQKNDLNNFTKTIDGETGKKLWAEYKLLYRDRSKTDWDLTQKMTQQKMLGKLYKHHFGAGIVKCEQRRRRNPITKKNEVVEVEYVWNEDYLLYHREIYQYTNINIVTARLGNEDYKWGEYEKQFDKTQPRALYHKVVKEITNRILWN